MTAIYDVAIVGAGPAGSTAAHFLALSGLRVVLLDKAGFPRDKTCGDGLTPRALPILEEMGLLDPVLQKGWRLNDLAITAPSGRSVEVTIPDLPHAPSYAVVIPRLKLDNLVREKAVSSGAVFQGGVHVRDIQSDESGVTIETDQGKERVHYAARAAVIATGASTRLLATIGLLRNPADMIVAGRAYFEGIQELPNSFQFRFDGVPVPGYGWIFPTSETSANIGAGFLPSARIGSAKPSTQTAFDHFIQHSVLKSMLADAHQVSPLKSFPIRTDFATAATTGNRILLAGEAAGLVNPLTGDGIDYALESGKIAAEHLISIFKSGDFSPAQFGAYDGLLRQRYQNLFRFCERVQRLCLNVRTLNTLVPMAAGHPRLAEVLVNRVLGATTSQEHLSALAVVRGIVANW